MRFSLILLPLALAACGSGADDGNITATGAADPVAAVAAPEGQAWTDIVVRTPEGGYRMGNPDAPIKLVEFGSRSCHACKDFEETAFAPLKANYISTGKVSFEFRDFLRSPLDVAAALVGQCAGPDAFFPLLEQQFAMQDDVLNRAQAMTEDQITRIQALPTDQQTTAFAEVIGMIDFARQRGIPEDTARKCLSDTATAQTLADMNAKASEEYEIPGTPTFLINGSVVPQTVNWEQLEVALKNAGA